MNDRQLSNNTINIMLNALMYISKTFNDVFLEKYLDEDELDAYKLVLYDGSYIYMQANWTTNENKEEFYYIYGYESNDKISADFSFDFGSRPCSKAVADKILKDIQFFIPLKGNFYEN